jgi:hypothetical protein
MVELDLGTENRGRLEDKMERYRVLARAETAPDVVLFCFPSEAREASARRILGGSRRKDSGRRSAPAASRNSRRS